MPEKIKLMLRLTSSLFSQNVKKIQAPRGCVCASKTRPTDSAASRVCASSVRETAIARVKIYLVDMRALIVWMTYLWCTCWGQPDCQRLGPGFKSLFCYSVPVAWLLIMTPNSELCRGSRYYPGKGSVSHSSQLLFPIDCLQHLVSSW